MTIQIPSIVFFLVILALTVFDAKRMNTIITPFTVTAWPFAIISIVNNFFLGALLFPPMTMRVHAFLLINLVIIWLVGYVIWNLYKVKGISITSVDSKAIFKPFVRYQYFLMVLSIVLSLIVFYKVSSLIGQFGGWWFFGEQQFEDMMSVGPVAHLVQLAKVCFILLFFIYPYSKRKLFIIITLVILFIAVAFLQVKYHIIWLMIIGFLYLNISKKLPQQLKGVANISLLVFLMMNVFWISLTFAWGTFSLQNEDVRDYLINNSINYFVSSPIILDRWLDWANIKPDWTMLIVFKNFFNVIIGNPARIDFVPYVTHGFYETGPGITGNTGTSFGVYYLIGGYPFTIFMTTLIGVISYLLYFQSFRSRSPILFYLNFIFLTMGMMSFFGQYFTIFSVYEMTVFFILIVSIFKVINLVYEKKGAIKKMAFDL